MSHDIKLQTLWNKAEALREHLSNPEWLQAIGIGSDDGSPCIYVYANKLRPARALVPNIWCDVPVKLKKLGKLSPA